VLFFFEASLFALAIVAIAVAEFWGKQQALLLWLAATALSLVTAPLIQLRLARSPPADRKEEQWRRALADSWRHLNRLLLLGMLALAGWWWLDTRLSA
jgi:hypothetical protein